jgi:hypothetical protein
MEPGLAAYITNRGPSLENRHRRSVSAEGSVSVSLGLF